MMGENLTWLHANNNDIDQPVHLRSLISAFLFTPWKNDIETDS